METKITADPQPYKLTAAVFKLTLHAFVVEEESPLIR